MIKSHEYKKVEKEIPFNLPTETLYFFKTGSRISVRVIPVWTTWNKEHGKEEEIWKLHITIVRNSFEAKMEAIGVQINNIPDIFRAAKGDVYEILYLINDAGNRLDRTKEQFDADFKTCLDEIKGKKI